MKAVCWMGKHDIRVENVPDPSILNSRDAIIKITTTAICGSDLHLYNGYIPTMQSGDILGHEFMGEVVETGSSVSNLKKGDRVVVPFTIACGNCFFCNKDLWSACDNSNPTPGISETLYGYAGSGLFGFSHMMGGFAGGQAEYVRVPFADVGPLKIPDGLEDEQIPLAARILRVSDTYAAMTAARPYRSAKTAEEAKKYLVEWSGIEFDPTVVKAFLVAAQKAQTKPQPVLQAQTA